jgi:acyl carrier protein
MTTSNRHQTIDAIAGFVKGRFPALSGADADAPLISSGAIDSLGVVELMAFLEERFSINLSEIELDESHFESVRSLAAFVEAQRPAS